jgi:hypothetical protein
MTDSWFYIRNKRKVGPVALKELEKLFLSGQLDGKDMVLQQGSAKWVEADTVSGLTSAGKNTSAAATPAMLQSPAPGLNSSEASPPPAGFRNRNRWIIACAGGLVAILVASLLIAGRRDPDSVPQPANAPQDRAEPQVAQSPSTSQLNVQNKPGVGQKPFQAKEEQAKTMNPAGNKDKSTVIAEGVGATGDAALKDAFRNAVRQVVGAVVDAETLVNDDQVIFDKILTYSDGFVKTYEELSKSQEKGLIRTKIRATVEQRSVIARLKASNVAVKDVDGKGIFAEVVTDRMPNS